MNFNIIFRLHQVSGSYLAGSHCRGLGFILGKSVWNFRWTRTHGNEFSSDTLVLFSHYHFTSLPSSCFIYLPSVLFNLSY